MNQRRNTPALAIIQAALFVCSSSVLAESTFTAGVSQGTVTASGIREASDVVASRDNANVLWTENDSGNTNQIFAMDTSGKLLGTYTLSGANNSDWEDMSVGPGPVPGVSYLYLMESNESGDPGRVYRVPEPTVYTGRQATSPVNVSLSGVQSKKFSFPAPDSEAMFVDPIDGSIYLGSKESPTVQTPFAATKFYRGTQTDFSAPGTTDLSSAYVGFAPLSKGNGADISPDGGQIIVRNQNQVAYLYNRAPGQSVASAFASTPTLVNINGKDVEPNAESIAFDANGNNLYTFSEGVNQQLYLYSRTSNDAPQAPVHLLQQGSTFHFISGGTTPAAGWQNSGFHDGSWSSGAGQFGYGHSDEQTAISFGGNASNKAAAAFFRTTFSVADPTAFSALTLKLLADDGAAVYLNGHEVLRENLAAGALPTDFALTATPDELQNVWASFGIDPSLLIAGLNTLAVEVHGSSATDNDLRFDAQLVATVPEPASLSLLAVGAALMLRRKRRI